RGRARSGRDARAPREDTAARPRRAWSPREGAGRAWRLRAADGDDGVWIERERRGPFAGNRAVREPVIELVEMSGTPWSRQARPTEKRQARAASLATMVTMS